MFKLVLQSRICFTFIHFSEFEIVSISFVSFESNFDLVSLSIFNFSCFKTVCSSNTVSKATCPQKTNKQKLRSVWDWRRSHDIKIWFFWLPFFDVSFKTDKTENDETLNDSLFMPANGLVYSCCGFEHVFRFIVFNYTTSLGMDQLQTLSRRRSS